MPAITATIITKNEESRIVEAIASLSCCDEVVVVDSGSTDKTIELARSMGARVIERAWHGYANQKQFAGEQARHDWILSIDADERLTVELSNEIFAWKRDSNARAAAWSMPRRVYYLGKWINHSGWYPDRKVRLYDRNRCRWAGDFVHESVQVSEKTGEFNGDLLHFPYRDWKDHAERLNRYTELAAQASLSNGRRGNVLKLLFAPPLTFVKHLVLRAGFLDGWRGFVIAYMGARYVFKKEFRILR